MKQVKLAGFSFIFGLTLSLLSIMFINITAQAIEFQNYQMNSAGETETNLYRERASESNEENKDKPEIPTYILVIFMAFLVFFPLFMLILRIIKEIRKK